MLRDNLVGLIVPMQSCRTQVLGDEFSYLENPRPVGAESSLTGRCSSPFQTEPRHNHGPHGFTHARLFTRHSRNSCDLFVGHLGRKNINSGPRNFQWYKRGCAFFSIGSDRDLKTPTTAFIVASLS
jgi:hypothetical protein